MKFDEIGILTDFSHGNIRNHTMTVSVITQKCNQGAWVDFGAMFQRSLNWSLMKNEVPLEGCKSTYNKTVIDWVSDNICFVVPSNQNSIIMFPIEPNLIWCFTRDNANVQVSNTTSISL